MPWFAKKIRHGNALRLVRLPDDLPAEATAERAYCSQSGLKSHLTIPLKERGLVVAGIGFNSFHSYRDWPDELIQRLRLVGEVFTHAPKGGSEAQKRCVMRLLRFSETGEELRTQPCTARQHLSHRTGRSCFRRYCAALCHHQRLPGCIEWSPCRVARWPNCGPGAPRGSCTND